MANARLGFGYKRFLIYICIEEPVQYAIPPIKIHYTTQPNDATAIFDYHYHV